MVQFSMVTWNDTLSNVAEVDTEFDQMFTCFFIFPHAAQLLISVDRNSSPATL